jgi:hypothetical protein
MLAVAVSKTGTGSSQNGDALDGLWQSGHIVRNSSTVF